MGEIKKLVEFIAQAIADCPEHIFVNEISGDQISIIELGGDKSDVGKLIGKGGRNVEAIRTIVNATATKLRKQVVVDILG